MTRKDTIANMTLGETLQAAIIKSLTLTFTPVIFVESVIAATQMIQDQLFDGNTNDYDSAQVLSEKFETAAVLNYADNPMAQQLYSDLSELCDEYIESIYHLYNEESDTLPF
jgi:hypothetical protein